MKVCDCGRLYEGDRTCCRICRSNFMRGTRMPTLDIRPTPAPWMAEASCRNMSVDLFFPQRGADSIYGALRMTCFACKVRLACLDDALVYEAAPGGHLRFGLRGGMTPKEREVEARRRLGMTA